MQVDARLQGGQGLSVHVSQPAGASLAASASLGDEQRGAISIPRASEQVAEGNSSRILLRQYVVRESVLPLIDAIVVQTDDVEVARASPEVRLDPAGENVERLEDIMGVEIVGIFLEIGPVERRHDVHDW